MSKPEKQYVWIFAVSHFRWLWKPLAADIQSRTGLHPILVVATSEDRKYYLGGNDGVLEDDQVIVLPEYYAEAMRTAPREWEELSRRARVYEDRFEISLARSVIQADRHLGRGYMWGWHGHPISFVSERSCQAAALKATLTQFDFFCNLFSSHPPGLVVGFGFGCSLATAPVWHVCAENKIPFRSLASARFGGMHYWAIDPFDNPSAEFQAAFNEQPALSIDEIENVMDILQPPAAFQALGKRPAYPTLRGSFKVAIRQLSMRLYQKFKGYSKASFGYKPIDAALTPFIDWMHGRYLHRLMPLSLADIPKHLRIVAAPLQVEPEASLQGQSQYASNHLNLLYETALSLPADAILVVKEHPLQVGRRSRWFYDCISKLPNAVLLDPSVSGAQLLERTEVVVQINSSMGYEAAARGIPVLVFSPHGPITVLDHVTVIQSVADLSCLRQILTNQADTQSAKRRRIDGARYALAVRRYCEEMPELRNYKREQGPSQYELEVLVGALLRTTNI